MPLLVEDMINEKIRTMVEKLKTLIIEPRMSLESEYVYTPQYKTSNTPPDRTAGWKPYIKNTVLRGMNEHHWFHFTIPAIPKSDGKELRLQVETGLEGKWDAFNPQGLVYLNGITTQALDTNHTWVPIEYEKEYDVYVYFFSSMTENPEYKMNFSLVDADIATESLYYDLLIPYDAMQELDKDSYDYITVRNCLDKAVFNLDLRDVKSKEYKDSVLKTADYMEKEFYNGICGNSKEIVSCIGHTHIDVAWYWTVAQTREKAQRSFSTVTKLMDRYDEYKFMSSQPQLYKFIKEDDPELYSRIKERVKEGRWEVDGAMWLEADTNLISGESLIRQILFGKRFMKDEFGVDSKILWLPDVFGYSAALPQIMKKCGIDKFFTAKISWNETNLLPFDMFMWEGIDGTQIFCSLLDGYVNNLNAKDINKMSKNFKDKNLSNDTIMTFGWGDGGGGPTPEMLEHYRRLNKGIPGLPKPVIKTAREYFDEVSEKYIAATTDLRCENRWLGELYLEMHRGTYTTIGKNKKNNRKSELLIMEAETLSATDMLLNSGDYPQDIFRKNQENILLNQFHDIIPGSSIREVYEVTDIEYENIISTTKGIISDKLQSIANRIKTDGGILIYNPTPYKLSDTVECNGKTYYAENIPAHGWRVIADIPTNKDISVTENALENDLIRVTFNDKYEIISVYDKEYEREVLSNKAIANRLEIFEDYPRDYDAWEISSYYKQKMWVVDDVTDIELQDDGITVTRKYMHSTIRQTIKLNKNSKRIDFDTYVDWHEDHVLLKASFPVDIHSSTAVYDIQFGNLERPTHRNTSWDAAKFEVCAHKWADLSEADYGVSILNDCKYGYSIENNIMKISLLKAPTHPYPEADRGEHTFTYSMLPHTGDFRKGHTIAEGYRLNMPMEAMAISPSDGSISDEFSLLSTDKENVIIETIKKAENDSSIIARVYEAFNSKSKCTISASFDFKEVYLCDMLENDIMKLDSDGRDINISIRNYEIVTLKFVI